MASNAIVLSRRKRPQHLIPKFPGHLTFSLPPASKRKIPHHKSVHAAAVAGDAIDVSLFINKGVDINAVDSVGDAPIHYACMSRHRNQYTIVKMLLANGANPLALTITGQTVLHLLAVHSKSPSTLSTLRHLVKSSGVDINIEDGIERTPLQYFLESCGSITNGRSVDIVKFFWLNGASTHRMPHNIANWMDYYNSIEECMLLTDIDSRTKLYKSLLYRFCGTYCDKFLNLMNRQVGEAEEFYRNELFIWGPDNSCTISKLSFLLMSEEKIADLAMKEPLLYFAIRRPFRCFSSKIPRIGRPVRSRIPAIHIPRHYQAQFNTFCYYFVKEQLKRVNFTNGEVTLNYDCVQTLASFLDLKDLVNLCEAFNFNNAAIDEIRKLNVKGRRFIKSLDNQSLTSPSQ